MDPLAVLAIQGLTRNPVSLPFRIPAFAEMTAFEVAICVEQRWTLYTGIGGETQRSRAHLSGFAPEPKRS